MAVAHLNGTDLFYVEVGEGRVPCLVMHGGLGGDHTCLHPWLDLLGGVMHLVYSPDSLPTVQSTKRGGIDDETSAIDGCHHGSDRGGGKRGGTGDQQDRHQWSRHFEGN
jgi:hypothetical protein